MHDQEPGCARSRPGLDMVVTTETMFLKKKNENFILLCVLNVEVG